MTTRYIYCLNSEQMFHGNIDAIRDSSEFKTNSSHKYNNSYLSASFNPCPRPLIGKGHWMFEGAGFKKIEKNYLPSF